jgi:hypothetical protein
MAAEKQENVEGTRARFVATRCDRASEDGGEEWGLCPRNAGGDRRRCGGAGMTRLFKNSNPTGGSKPKPPKDLPPM